MYKTKNENHRRNENVHRFGKFISRSQQVLNICEEQYYSWTFFTNWVGNKTAIYGGSSVRVGGWVFSATSAPFIWSNKSIRLPFIVLHLSEQFQFPLIVLIFLDCRVAPVTAVGEIGWGSALHISHPFFARTFNALLISVLASSACAGGGTEI